MLVPGILGEAEDFVQPADDASVKVDEAGDSSENRDIIAAEAENRPDRARQFNRKARQSFSSFSSFGDNSRPQTGGFSFQRVRMGQDNIRNDPTTLNFEVKYKLFEFSLNNVFF